MDELQSAPFELPDDSAGILWLRLKILDAIEECHRLYPVSMDGTLNKELPKTKELLLFSRSQATIRDELRPAISKLRFLNEHWPYFKDAELTSNLKSAYDALPK